MAKIHYQEPDDKKKYNKMRKEWAKINHTKAKKYKGIDFDMENVDFEKPPKKTKKAWKYIILIAVIIFALYKLFIAFIALGISDF